MRRSWSALLVGTIVLAASAGCEAGPRQTPEGPTAPTAPALSRTVSDYVLIQGRIPSHIGDLDVSQLIGVNGGSVHVAGHSIEVPAGAVTQPTVFTMTLLTNGYVQVELKALLSGLLGRLTDVGGAGFNGRTVKLSLTYAWASNVGDPSELVILRMNENGSVEPLAVTVDQKGKTVSAELEHFSRYAMASN